MKTNNFNRRGPQSRILRDSQSFAEQKLYARYPVEEGLVFRAEDYVYSSATDYAGGKGLLDIFVIE